VEARHPYGAVGLRIIRHLELFWDQYVLYNIVVASVIVFLLTLPKYNNWQVCSKRGPDSRGRVEQRPLLQWATGQHSVV